MFRIQKKFATQVAAAHDNKGAVRLLLEKGFVLLIKAKAWNH